MWNDIHTERVIRYLINGKTYAVNTNGTLFGNVAADLKRNPDNKFNRAGIGLASLYMADTIDMPADQVPAKALSEPD